MERLDLGRSLRRLLRLPLAAALVVAALPVEVSRGSSEADQPARVQATAAVTFELQVPASAPALHSGSLVIEPVSPGSDAAPLALAVGGGRPLLTELPVGSEWRVSAAVPSFWIRPETFVVSSPDAVVHPLRLWPLAHVTGSLRLLEAGAQVPREVSLATVVLPIGASRDLPVARVSCPVDRTGSFRCDFPAATADLVIAARGFIPSYRWGVRLAAGKTHDLGRLDLAAGASVVGWAEAEGGALDPVTCKARLVPLAADDPGAAMRLAATAPGAAVGKDGFFQISGVPPGGYRLEVLQPGYAPAGFGPLSVLAGGETFVNRPLTLRRLLQLEISIVPPLDGRGQRWEVRLARRSEAASALASGPETSRKADEEGRVSFADQPPGRFIVKVADSEGNRLHSADLTVTGPEDAEQVLHLRLVPIHGSLRLGKEPLAATLWFGGRYGPTAVRMQSDRDGVFEGMLPRDGAWPVEIAAERPEIATRADVRVQARRDGAAEIEIELPDTRLFGRVVEDEGGRPVAGAEVSLLASGVLLPLETDARGEFVGRAFPPGPVHLSALHGKAASSQVDVVVPRDREVGPIELRLRRLRPFSGTVVSSQGPVRGAKVSVVPWRPALVPGDSASTDLAGGFTAHVPERTGTVLAVVEAPGYVLQAFEVGSDAPALLRVADLGGTLDLALPARLDELTAKGLTLVVLQGDLPLPAGSLLSWIQSHGGDVAEALGGSSRHLPDLAPGRYRSCLVETARLLEWQQSGWREDLAICDAGALAAGATLRLAIALHPGKS